MVVSVVPIGNSRGIRLPKVVLDSLSIQDEMDMEVTDAGILLTPIRKEPRHGWREAFCAMHQRGDDELEDIPAGEDFEWEW